jgi:hypothetical protein
MEYLKAQKSQGDEKLKVICLEKPNKTTAKTAFE